MKRFVINFLFLLCCFLVKSQCPVDHVVISSQQELDDFQLLYPSCKTIDFDVTIEGADITDLSPMNAIEIISGELSILNNDAMDSINGFNQLRRIESNFSIKGNTLWDMSGLSNLEFIGGDFEYFYNQNGVLNGLSALDTIGGSLYLHQVLFSNFNNMGNIAFIGGSLNLSACSVSQLHGLSKVKSLGGDLIIQNCHNLTSLTGLHGLERIDGRLILNNNNGLIFINALRQIDYLSIEDLLLMNSSELSNCDLENFCTYLDNGGSNMIENNRIGCDSAEEVLEKCDLTNEHNITREEIDLFPNPFNDHFIVKLKRNELVKFKVVNTLGTIIKTGEFRTFHQIDMENTEKGTYYLNLNAESWNITLKVINI